MKFGGPSQGMALSPTYTRIHPPMRERCGGPQAGWTCILPVLSDCSPCGERCRVPNIRCVEGVAGPIIGNSIRTAVEVYELHGGPGKQFSSTLVSSAQHRCAGKIVVNAVPHMSWWVLGVCTLYRYLYLGTENKLGKSKPGYSFTTAGFLRFWSSGRRGKSGAVCRSCNSKDLETGELAGRIQTCSMK